MAMSVNGITARNNNKEDFLSDKNWDVFCKLAKKHGCFVVGRKTYEIVMRLYKDYNFDDVKARKIIVSSGGFKAKDFIAATSPKDAIEKARRMGFKRILLSGGS
ncbi:MAG: hypothetical protein HY460_02700, partial [Parcubacteria group bacterium]|nr:hypothetical protein [Parcubacteria group bacterium]